MLNRLAECQAVLFIFNYQFDNFYVFITVDVFSIIIYNIMLRKCNQLQSSRMRNR